MFVSKTYESRVLKMLDMYFAGIKVRLQHYKKLMKWINKRVRNVIRSLNLIQDPGETSRNVWKMLFGSRSLTLLISTLANKSRRQNTKLKN